MLPKPIFDYCERTGTSLFNEPLNTLSNAAFFITAWLLWRNYQKTRQSRDSGSIILIALITCIGIGSMLFHMSPNRITMYGDVVPIAVFVIVSLYMCLRRLLDISALYALLLVLVFIFANALTTWVPYPYRFNGSVGYFPCLMALVLISIALRRRQHAAAGYFFKIACVFIVSLMFRSSDIILCKTLPAGTHFLWHICNGIVVYMIAETIRKQKIN